MKKNQKGVSMIEVLVSFMLLSVVLLGAAGVQANVMKQSTTAMTQTMADILVKQMIEKIRNNQNEIATYTSAAPTSAPSCFTSTTGCTTNSDIAKYDMYMWSKDVQSKLPNGEFSITNQAGLVTVTVRWNDSPSGGSSGTKSNWSVSAYLGNNLGLVI